MVPLDSTKSGLDSDVWIDGFDYQSKEKNANDKNPPFYMCSVSEQKSWRPFARNCSYGVF